MRRRLVILAAALALSGCAASGAATSFVQVPATVKVNQVAANMTGLVAHVLPPAHTTVKIEPPARKAGKKFAASFEAAMRARGFGVSTTAGVPVRYAVSVFNKAVLLRVWAGKSVVSRAYQANDAGKLVPVSPMTVGKG